MHVWYRSGRRIRTTKPPPALFLDRQYPRLIAMYREADPTHLTSESLLALFLAAAHQGEKDLSERWGQEIKRRNPQAEAVRWVDLLAKSRKSAS